ncbi:uncharacterized protein LOC101476772 isoform X2 [Maylandia zebra]|uniref:uncharacterized protein LOC101476772 isoform X2 n=1 Tax=Maylandia zebra TaxID=106582 RepID=UPI00403CC371
MWLTCAGMDRETNEARQESPWTMMFANDILICIESGKLVEDILEKWRDAVERRGMTRCPSLALCPMPADCAGATETFLPTQRVPQTVIQTSCRCYHSPPAFSPSMNRRQVPEAEAKSHRIFTRDKTLLLYCEPCRRWNKTKLQKSRSGRPLLSHSAGMRLSTD